MTRPTRTPRVHYEAPRPLRYESRPVPRVCLERPAITERTSRRRHHRGQVAILAVALFALGLWIGDAWDDDGGVYLAAVAGSVLAVMTWLLCHELDDAIDET